MTVRGVIFDFDGTLVDSKLDFQAIRREMSLADGQPILEALEQMPEGDRKLRCLEILARHEMQGARCATLIPGVADFLRELETRRMKCGVLTRNSRIATDVVIERLGLEFNTVLTREDAPAKPDPEGLLMICREWKVAPAEVVFIGDFLFDIEAGNRAGTRTILYAPENVPGYAELADQVIHHFADAISLIEA